MDGSSNVCSADLIALAQNFGGETCECPGSVLLARLCAAQDKPPHHSRPGAVPPPCVAGAPTPAFELSRAAFHRGVAHQSFFGPALWPLLRPRLRHIPLPAPNQHYIGSTSCWKRVSQYV